MGMLQRLEDGITYITSRNSRIYRIYRRRRILLTSNFSNCQMIVSCTSYRDPRILGAQKMDLKKMGAAHCFFFLRRPFCFFFISWAPRPSCAHQFFFFLRPLFFFNRGNLSINFFCFCTYSQFVAPIGLF